MSQYPKDQLLESLSALVDNEASELEVRRLLKQADEQKELAQRWHRYQLIGSLLREEEGAGLSESGDFLAKLSSKLHEEQSDLEGKTTSATAMTEQVSDSSAQRSKAIVSQERAEATHESNKAGVHKLFGDDKKQVWSMLGKVSVAASFAFVIIASFNVFDNADQRSIPGEGALAQQDGVMPVQADAVQSSVAAAPRGFTLPSIGARTVSQSNIQPSAFEALQRPVSMQKNSDLSDAETQSMLNEMLILHAERASANGSISLLPFARVSKMQHPGQSVNSAGQ